MPGSDTADAHPHDLSRPRTRPDGRPSFEPIPTQRRSVRDGPITPESLAMSTDVSSPFPLARRTAAWTVGLALMALAFITAPAHADEGVPPLDLRWPPLQLAAASEPRARETADAPAFKPPLFTGSDAHKYLGLGTLVLLGLTAATSPHDDCEHDCAAGTSHRQTSGTTHTRLARATAAMAAATVTTGLIVHWDDFHLKDGWSDPDNQHVALGLAGSMLLMYAVNKSMHSSVPTQHAGFAELGGAAMAVAIKLTW